MGGFRGGPASSYAISANTKIGGEFRGLFRGNITEKLGPRIPFCKHPAVIILILVKTSAPVTTHCIRTVRITYFVPLTLNLLLLEHPR